MNVKKTREAILDNSITIFNEKKPSKVSTVQIADQMGISPGNLYYYFGNKEEIIRCIWNERIMSNVKETFSEHKDLNSGADIVRIFKSTIDHIRSYKFFYSEISTILNNDDILNNEMQKTILENKENLYDFIEILISKGMFRELSDEEKVTVADIICAISGKAFYSNYAYAAYNEIGEKIIDVLLVNILMVINPYVSDNCWRDIMNELERNGIDYRENADIIKKQYVF